MKLSPLLRAELRRAIVKLLWDCSEHRVRKPAEIDLDDVTEIIFIIDTAIASCNVELAFPQPIGMDKDGNVI